MKILVTGGRDFADRDFFWITMSRFYERPDIDISCIIEGGARGADRMGREWAVNRGVPVITVEAQWDAHGKGAGTKRNKWMLDLCKPDMVMAFDGGAGTANMISQAIKAKVEVRVNKFDPYQGL